MPKRAKDNISAWIDDGSLGIQRKQPASLSWERAVLLYPNYSGFFWEKLTSGVVIRS